MRLLRLLPAIICLLLCSPTFAISVPGITSIRTAFEDTTVSKFVSLSPAPALPKKVGFFSKLKRELFATLLKVHGNTKSKSSTKSILGWVALGMIGLSVLLLALSSGSFAGWLFLGGLLTGLVSLCMPRSEADKREKKKSNTGAIIALAVGISLVIALAIAIGSGFK